MAAVNRIDLSHHIEASPEGLLHRVDLDGLPKSIVGPRSLYWKLRGVEDMPPSPVLDHFVIGLALPLAAAGGEVRVHGAMSRRGLFNALRLLELRRVTSPGRYKALEITPDTVIDLPPPDPTDRRAILAFSGGLDSTHAALHHAAGNARQDSLDLRALVMVHGFDAPIERPDIFSRMLERATPLATRLGIPLLSVETNSKYLHGSLWPQTATPLAAVSLSLFSSLGRYGIFGGGLQYGANFLPLGHQPLFDQYCSNRNFTLLTDAAGLTRKQKILNLASDPSVLAGLRVCWKGPDVSRNCGQCAKCTLTKLNLRMAGLDERLAFDTAFDPERLRATAPRSMYDARDMGEYCWHDLKGDPNLQREASLVRELLAAVPPVSIAAAGRGVIFNLLLPRSVQTVMASMRLWIGGHKRRAKRHIKRWMTGKPAAVPRQANL